MLLAEDPLDLLIERLRGLPSPDRRAILQRLSTVERRRVETALETAAPLPTPRFAPDIAARIAGPQADGAMTSAARDVLLRVAGTVAPVAASPPGPSLFARLGDAVRGR